MPTTDSSTPKPRRTRQPTVHLAGQRYGLLTVLYETSRKGRNRRYICECDCGRVTVAHMMSLRGGSTRSCGCLRVSTPRTHGHKSGVWQSPVHRVWSGMLRRCRCVTDDAYQNYGGRGIRVCERWLKFENFFADMGYPPTGRSLERIDNDGNYEPSNCRWATRTEQARNTRRNRFITFEGQTKTLAEWSELTNLSGEVIAHRLKIGWGVERALTTPLLRRMSVS
jgi:hypothetical protein